MHNLENHVSEPTPTMPAIEPTPATPAAAPAAPVAPAIPAGHELISSEDLSRLRRNEERFRGSEPMVQSALGSGLKSAQEIQSAGSLVSELKSLGYTGAQAVELIRAGAAPAAPAQSDPFAERSPAADIAATVKSEFARESHGSSSAQEAQTIQSQVEAALAGIPEADHDFLRGVISSKINDSRDLYPENHPLRKEHFKPLEGAKIQEVIASVTSRFGGQPPAAGTPAATASQATAPPRPGYKQTAAGTPQPTEPGSNFRTTDQRINDALTARKSAASAGV